MSDRGAADLDPRSRAQVAEVAEVVRSVLGDDAIGAYLYGSAVLGGLRPSSDLDVFAVVARPMTPADREAIVDRLIPISGSHALAGPARSIELTIVVQSDVRPWRYPPRVDFLYGDWLRGSYERGDPPAEPRLNPDLAVLITAVRVAGVGLFGPPPADVLDPVPSADLRRAAIDVVPGLIADLEPDTRNVVLTLARIWMTRATGEIRPKDVAADWVLARLPAEHRRVLEHARAVYLGAETERWGDLQSLVRPHVKYVVAQLAAANATRPGRS